MYMCIRQDNPRIKFLSFQRTTKLSLTHPQATVAVQITVPVHGGRNISKCSSHHDLLCRGEEW
jgi:hypothetical protein